MMGAVVQSSSSPSSDCDLHALRDMLERVETLPEEACGALLFSDSGNRKGTLYVEHGRICWAVARGMGRRLTDLVLGEAASGITHTQMEALYKACRVDGRPWGQTLVEQGVIEPAGLRLALAKHTAEALSAMSQWSRPTCHWLDRGQVSYDAMFTFSTPEIAATVGASRHAGARAERLAELRALVPEGAFGAAYPWPESERDQLPIAVVGADARPVETVIDLGKWAHNQLELARAMAQECSPVTAVSAAGGAVVAWTTAGGFAAAVCDTFQMLARMLSNHMRFARATP